MTKLTDTEIKSEFNRIEKLDSILDKLTETYSQSISSQIDRECIFNALYLQLQNEFNFEHPVDLWNIEIDIKKAETILSKFDFNTVLNKIETSENIIPREYLVNYKVRIKSKNKQWMIHKYDSDPFPSNPHAHLIDSNIKMDLSNGNYFKKKKFVGKVKEKELLKIREKAESYNFKLPPLNLN